MGMCGQSWIGYSSRIFNVGEYRRVMAHEDPNGMKQDASFFDPFNKEAVRLREEAAQHCMEDLVRWAQSLSSGCVAIFDATNTTAARRKQLYDYFTGVVDEKGNPMQVMFVESVVTGEFGADVVKRNVTEVKLTGPDYTGTDPEVAMRDFLERIKQYEKVYETMVEDEGVPFVKVIDAGRAFQVHRPHGHIQTRISYFLMNLNITPKSIYFTRHGESEFNVEGKIGGDSNLSERGWLYAAKLPDVMGKILPPETKLQIWTSSLVRTIQTASFAAMSASGVSPGISPTVTPTGATPRAPFHRAPTLVSWKALDELDSGYCDGLTYEEIAEKFPEEYAARDADKFYFRYRGGESYADLCRRIEPVIMELERVGADDTVLIVGHQAVLRCVYAWFQGYGQEELPYLKVPLHCVIKLSPRAYGCQVESWTVDIPAVETGDKPGRTTW
ncbi:fructose-2,6-bisphosphatase [Gonapodya prolifera JEL478]|uniref:Fructose-2,6-bisphosphatase n=1 Tax=Gonapodya prolifera (strain JEL478) TaxID=1344416 RepID=A0A138ZYM9_GONPJ|nr:fructose-2,6-bisphosphatase [Gonapodya prolifera JEL478]|eukprot:KXS09375.1 fructose-2,6-bisphosphatase [Gonapodya prolifera JEL478]